ncbi:MAG: PD-(D/E)XK nuclease family protein, partial [Pyrinomonadaceae bacterium]
TQDGLLKFEIIDFKTNRVTGSRSTTQTVASPNRPGQFAFDFESSSVAVVSATQSTADAVRLAAQDYVLQMQAYALVARELIPNLPSVEATLHFLEPNLEFKIPRELLAAEVCRKAIDEAMSGIVSHSEADEFPVNPAAHCRICNYSEICAAGRDWLRQA